MIKLELVKFHNKHATYRYEWQDRKDVLNIGPGEDSYGLGWTAIMVGKFDKWTLLEKQVYIRKHEDGEWYTATSLFGERGRGQAMARLLNDKANCLCHFFDTVYHQWLNDLMLKETPAAPDGA